jgi:hypothetical protein
MRAARNQRTQTQFAIAGGLNRRRSLKRSERGGSGASDPPEPSFAGMPCSLRDIADALNALALPQPLELLEGHDGFQSRSLEPLQ